jgi:O-antigen ligase
LFVASFYISDVDISTSILKSTGRTASFTGRTVLWEKALIAANDNPIFGYGFDGLLPLTKKYHLLMVHLHNGYIETLVKGGMISITLLSYIIIKTLIYQFRIRLKYKSDLIFLNSGLIMILVHNITESSVLKGLNSLNILLILIIASTNLLKSANTIKPPLTN